MSSIFRDIFKVIARFFENRTRYRFALLCILGIFAASDFLISGLARRTFVFYTINDNRTIVENRNIAKSKSRELNISRYVDEAILGPVTPDVLPLFQKGTRLLSLLYRDGLVYVNFSEDAALPPEEGGELFKNLNTLYNGIKRNFSYVSDIYFFIGGKEAFSGAFR